MGYGDQIGDLGYIQEHAKNLYTWINGDKGVFPPYAIIESITPRLQAIRRELEIYLRAIEHQTPSDPQLRARVEPLVEPYQVLEVMAASHGTGAYVLVGAPYRAGWDRDVRGARFEPEAGGEISVAVYVDSDERDLQRRILAAVDALVDAMGYDGPLDETTERGSIFRRSRAKAKQVLTSPELQARLVKIERAIEVAGLELNQAEVDRREADAVARVLSELRDVPRACVRAGSVVVAKFTTQTGPVILARTLSQIEIRALERFPELQQHPEMFLESLAIAVESLSTDLSEAPNGTDHDA